MADPIVLCRLDEIPEGGAKGFVIGTGAARRDLFGVRRGRQVFIYENSCPHTGGPLDWQPDVFLDVETAHIQCATHGALFRIGDGFCIHGPCLGKHLTALPARIEAGRIWIEA
ncbi:MAG: Rieske (2Fe-2S) protein [Alphaproteobacteria bacterium]|nr:Rieske (2Fe-2S) protein [Alphaproteobacteria bacterium]